MLGAMTFCPELNLFQFYGILICETAEKDEDIHTYLFDEFLMELKYFSMILI